MNLATALRYLDQHTNLEATAGRAEGLSLDRMRRLVSVLGDPQAAYPVIHITGTTTGWIGGEVVPCIDAQTQTAHPQGSEPSPRDVFDLRLLQKQFGVSLPGGYW